MLVTHTLALAVHLASVWGPEQCYSHNALLFPARLLVQPAVCLALLSFVLRMLRKCKSVKSPAVAAAHTLIANHRSNGLFTKAILCPSGPAQLALLV